MIMGRAAAPPCRLDNPDGTGTREPVANAGALYLAALGEEDLQPGGFVLPRLSCMGNTLATVSPREVASF
jgi:hypothetical protein